MKNLHPENNSGQGTGSFPILENNDGLTSQSSKKVIIKGVKCKCNKSWCPKCSLKTTIKKFAGYFKEWDFRRVRQLVFTVDPKGFENPEKAYLEITKNKKIPGPMCANDGWICVKPYRYWIWSNGEFVNKYAYCERSALSGLFWRIFLNNQYKKD
ncbi:MAG: hypothetical protein JRI36_09530 [Deltaproteobacteria bacterium]|nr:hypothetical protein [Deltaproteobacteria bacterium]